MFRRDAEMIHGRESSQDWQLAGGERSKAELSVAPETLQDWRRGVRGGRWIFPAVLTDTKRADRRTPPSVTKNHRSNRLSSQGFEVRKRMVTPWIYLGGELSAGGEVEVSEEARGARNERVSVFTRRWWVACR